VDEQALLSLGLWIKRRRKALDLTQDALAARVGCSKELIVKIEGDARRPSRQIAALLAQHLELAPDEIDDFVRCARAELAPDRLPSPTRSVPRAAFPSKPQAEHPRGNLPAQLSSFIGREQALADLRTLLRREGVRLVTLTGPGGIGKTRLALQVAAELALTPSPSPIAMGEGSEALSPPRLPQRERGSGGEGLFPDGVFFVDLAPISDPELVVTTIAQTLGVTATSEQPADQLKAALRYKRLLLLLDNFEQVLEAAPLVAELLAAAPGLKVLATSRVALHLTGEHEYAVPPLALPPTTDHRPPANDQRPTQGQAETIGQYAAVALFIQRAQAAKVGFTVTNATAPAVAEICVRLDGLPLAIELAAARIKLFPPEALLAHLVHPLALLTAGSRDLPARQQTIRATIDWSYNLLSAEEQRLFRRLGVFVGGFTIEAAEAVASEDIRQKVKGKTADSDTLLPFTFYLLPSLEALVDHSLLVVLEPAGGEPRYGMLELVREYALERLREGEEQETARRCHAAYFATWAEEVQPGLHEADMVAWLDQLGRELGNFRAVLDWSLAADDDDALYGLRLFGSIWELWFLRYSTEGGAIAERALVGASARHQDLVAAQIYNAAARLQKNPWGSTRSIDLLERSLALVRQYDDRPLLAEVLRHLGEATYTHDLEAAEPIFEESLRICRELDDAEQEGWTTCNLGTVAGLRGDLDQAESRYQHSLAIFERLGHPYGQVTALRNLSMLAERRGDHLAADGYLARAVELMNRFGSLSGASPLFDSGRLACQRGDYQRALDLLRSAYDHALQLSNDHSAMFALMWQAVCHLELGDLVAATPLCRQVMAIALDIADDFCLSEIAIIVANVVVAGRKHISAARLLGCVDMYRTSTGLQLEHDEEADWKRLYDRALDACRAALGEEAFQAAWAAGQALTLEQVVAEALAAADDRRPATEPAPGDATR
jgi:predicted ATPase/transcriptional regulator with XRE-family HTH domain